MGISLLSIVGKIDGKTVTDRVQEITEHFRCEEKDGLRGGKQCGPAFHTEDDSLKIPGKERETVCCIYKFGELL